MKNLFVHSIHRQSWRLHPQSPHPHEADSPHHDESFGYFSWSEAFYNEPKLYVDNQLIDPKHYSVGAGSAKLTFKNSFPNLNDYTYEQVKLIVEETGREYQNLLSSGNIEYFNAESFSKNQITSDQIANYNHNYFFRYKNAAKFLPNKQLISGFGNTIFYPENTLSDLQFNTDTNFIFKTLNRKTKKDQSEVNKL
jgi:hypothetical protein